MYKKLVALSVLVLLVAAVFAQEGTKPVKKIPAKEGNFEVIAGGMVGTPIDMERFAEVAARSARVHGWKVLGEELGMIRMRLEKNSWWVEMNICYWEDEYWFEYQNSWNLDANPAKNKIHRNYRRWIANIEKQILIGY